RARAGPLRRGGRDHARCRHCTRAASSAGDRAGCPLGGRVEAVLREAVAERDGLGPVLADLGPSDPVGPRTFDASGLEVRVGDALTILPGLPEASVDFVATDPPYNIQLPITMSGGRLAEAHANRRTDYAMVSDHPADLANSPDYETYLVRMERIFRELIRVLRAGRYAAVIVRDAYQDGRYRFVAAGLGERAERAGFVTKGDLVWYQAGTRLRPYGYPKVFVPNITHQHIVILRRPAGALPPARSRRRARP